MCPWQWMDGQGPSGQCSPGQEWWIQLHQWIAVINRVARRWRLTATRQQWAPGVASRDRAGSGMQVNQASQCYTSQCKKHALQRRWSALIQRQAASQIYFFSRLLLSRRAKDEHTASRQVTALHCLPLQMKCAASLCTRLHRHGEALKHWPCSGTVWIRYCSLLPWTVTTLISALLMDLYTARWSLRRISCLLWN